VNLLFGLHGDSWSRGQSGTLVAEPQSVGGGGEKGGASRGHPLGAVRQEPGVPPGAAPARVERRKDPGPSDPPLLPAPVVTGEGAAASGEGTTNGSKALRPAAATTRTRTHDEGGSGGAGPRCGACYKRWRINDDK
jgi:hypothetical protein